MDFKRQLRKRKPVAQVEPEPKKVENLYIIPGSFIAFDTLEEAKAALRQGHVGVYKLVARAKFNKVVEDVE